MILEHFSAVETRLKADTALTVYDTQAPLDPDGVLPQRGNYVVLMGGSPDELDSGRLTADQLPDSDATFVYTARCVATTPAGVRAVASHVLDQLSGFRPVIAGRNCHKVKLTLSRKMFTDNNVKPPLFYSDDEYTLLSRKA